MRGLFLVFFAVIFATQNSIFWVAFLDPPKTFLKIFYLFCNFWRGVSVYNIVTFTNIYFYNILKLITNENFSYFKPY